MVLLKILLFFFAVFTLKYFEMVNLSSAEQREEGREEAREDLECADMYGASVRWRFKVQKGAEKRCFWLSICKQIPGAARVCVGLCVCEAMCVYQCVCVYANTSERLSQQRQSENCQLNKKVDRHVHAQVHTHTHTLMNKWPVLCGSNFPFSFFLIV